MNNKDLIARHLEVALQAARLAGSYVLEAGKNPNIQVHDKHQNDFVTDADRACEQLIISTIRLTFPDDRIFGEETGTSGCGGHGRWILDPIDGTTNFFRSLPNYTISIAWELEPYHPLVGVVYNPRQQELFWGSEGEGVYLNGQPIAVSSVTDFTKALMVCVPPHRQHQLVDGYFETAKKLFLATSDFRSFGSCALELAYIAAGRLDGYYELCLGYYDMAAGMLLVREAGGLVESADPGQPFTDARCDLIASNGLIHSQILHKVHA